MTSMTVTSAVTDYLSLSPTEIATKIHSGQISPIEVIEAYIDRIKSVNPAINAVVVDNFDEARRRAQTIEENLPDIDNPPPLLGVPFTVKEMISLEGKPITCGSQKRSKARSKQNADVVQNLIDAGAIPLGQTNIPELGLWVESYNQVYGKTKNPHNLNKTSGGSSGGEASVIAAGGSSFGVGSDVGGSIRLPSSFCGIYGHKSTARQVSQLGHFPHEHSEASFDSIPNKKLISVGPLTRHASDLKYLFEIFRSGKTGISLHEPTINRIDFTEVTIHTLPDPEIQWTSSTSSAQKDAVKHATDLFKQKGATVNLFPEDIFSSAADIYTAFMERDELPAMEYMAGMGDSINVLVDMMKKPLGLSSHTMPLLMVCLMDEYVTDLMKRLGSTSEKAVSLRDEIIDRIGSDGILIMPPYPTAAPRHHQTLWSPLDLLYSGIFNALDLPVTTAPVGTNSQGLPTGVQLVVTPGNDDLSIGAAVELERSLGTPEVVTPEND